MKIDKNKVLFTCDDDLSQYVDSLLFDDESIATLRYENWLIVLDVSGEKTICYKDDVYHYSNDYPEELIKLIKSGKIYDYDNDDYYLQDNNWFDIVVYKDGYYIHDDVFEDDLAKLKPDDVKTILIDVLQYFLEDEEEDE